MLEQGSLNLQLVRIQQSRKDWHKIVEVKTVFVTNPKDLMHLGSYDALYTNNLRIFSKALQTMREIHVRIGCFPKNVQYAREVVRGIFPRFLILAFAAMVKIHTYLFGNLGQ